MLHLKVLILEPGAVDRLAPSAVSLSEVSTLAHKVGDDTVENGVLVAESLLASAQSSEIFRRLGNHVIVEFHDDSTIGFTINSYFEEDLGNAKHNLMTLQIITRADWCQWNLQEPHTNVRET